MRSASRANCAWQRRPGDYANAEETKNREYRRRFGRPATRARRERQIAAQNMEWHSEFRADFYACESVYRSDRGTDQLQPTPQRVPLSYQAANILSCLRQDD